VEEKDGIGNVRMRMRITRERERERDTTRKRRKTPSSCAADVMKCDGIEKKKEMFFSCRTAMGESWNKTHAMGMVAE